MSEVPPDPERSEASSGARWVKAKVVDDSASVDPAPELDSTISPAEPISEQPPLSVPPVEESDISSARWFAVAFLVIMVPLGLIVLGLVVWAFFSNLTLP